MTNNGMAETSLQAFRQKLKDGTVETDRERVFKIIDKYGPLTSEEMELHMGKNKHKFSGRINELRDNFNVIEQVGTKDGHKLYDIKKEQKQEEKLLWPKN